MGIYSEFRNTPYAAGMHKLLYVSATMRDFPEDGLKAILAHARKYNSTIGVTGLLLYIDGGFLQVLEGERQTLYDLYGKIAQDNRHWEAQLLMDEQGPRNFGEWSMGFRSLEKEQADAGLVDITQDAIGGLVKPGFAKPLLDVLIRTFCVVHGST